MKHVGPATALLLALSVPLRAEGQGTELFGGYSYARISDASRHGGNTAVAFDLRSPLGLKVDLSAHFASGEGTDLSDLTLMAGPVFRFGRGGAIFFLHALAGLYRERASLSVFEVTISESESRFGALFGAGSTCGSPVAGRCASRAITSGAGRRAPARPACASRQASSSVRAAPRRRRRDHAPPFRRRHRRHPGQRLRLQRVRRRQLAHRSGPRQPRPHALARHHRGPHPPHGRGRNRGHECHSGGRPRRSARGDPDDRHPGGGGVADLHAPGLHRGLARGRRGDSRLSLPRLALSGERTDRQRPRRAPARKLPRRRPGQRGRHQADLRRKRPCNRPLCAEGSRPRRTRPLRPSPIRQGAREDTARGRSFWRARSRWTSCLSHLPGAEEAARAGQRPREHRPHPRGVLWRGADHGGGASALAGVEQRRPVADDQQRRRVVLVQQEQEPAVGGHVVGRGMGDPRGRPEQSSWRQRPFPCGYRRAPPSASGRREDSRARAHRG